MPCILCGPATPPDKTGEPFGSTAIISISGLFSFNLLPIPVILPPVPTQEIKTSNFPASSIISFAVVI